MKLKDWIKSKHIKVKSVEYVDRNPYLDARDNKLMDNWMIEIEACDSDDDKNPVNCRHIKTYYSQGKGYYGEEPKIDNVMETLRSEAASIESADFDMEDFASQLGFSVDALAEIKRLKSDFTELSREEDESVEGYDNWEDWARDYGYGDEIEEAQRIKRVFEGTKEIHEKIEDLLGDDFDEFLWDND